MGMWEQKPYKAKTFRIANETETQNKKKKKKQLTCKNKTNQKLKKKQLTRNKNEKWKIVVNKQFSYPWLKFYIR